MSEAKAPKYQVFFRTGRGGRGLEYETAKAEFLSVFGDQWVEILWEIPGRMRMDVAFLGLSAGEVSRRAEDLGYTHGIISVHEEPYLGEELSSRESGRWVVGWIRRGNSKLYLTEVYRQDEDKLLADAPHHRMFLIEMGGAVKAAKGHRYHRGLSPFDARFILNIAQLRGDELILDPFAGIGGIVIECMRRNLRVFAADVDVVLRPGLAQFSRNRCAIADARQLPFKNSTFDVIITEPPFNTKYRQAVLDSIPELLRVVRHGERVVFLIAQDMHKEIIDRMGGSEFQLTKDFVLRRHGNLTSHVLRFDRSNSDPL